MGDMMDGMFGVSVLGMIIMVIVMVAVIGLAIAGVVWVVRGVDGRSRRANEPPAVEGPREILQRRYAAGEIDEDEYFRRLSGIEQP